MHAHHRAGDLAVEIQVADVQVFAGALQALGHVREQAARQAKLGVVRHIHRLVEVARLDKGQHRAKDLFLRQARIGRNVGKDRRRREIALVVGVVRQLPAQHQPAFLLADLDVLANFIE